MEPDIKLLEYRLERVEDALKTKVDESRYKLVETCLFSFIGVIVFGFLSFLIGGVWK